MKSIIVDIYIPADEWLKIYRGEARNVYATSRDGRSVQFPAGILQRYVTREGIQGSFQIQYDDAGKFAGLLRLS